MTDFTEFAFPLLTGLTPRTEPARWLDLFVNVKDYGADCNGKSDDTAAFQAALDAAFARKPRQVVYVRGTMSFDPASIEWRPNVPVYINGALKPTTTIVLPSNTALIGLGGDTSGIQFGRGPCAQIVAPPGAIPTILIQGSADHSLKNLAIHGAYVGVKADGASGLGALLEMENVNILCNQAGGDAILIDAFFWVWVNGCSLLTTSAARKSIFITNTETKYSQAGLLYFTDCVTASRGIMIDPGDKGRCGNIYFRNHHHESLPEDEVLVYARRAYNLTFSQFAGSDAARGAGHAFDVDGVTGFRLDNASQSLSFASYPASMSRETSISTYYSKRSIDVGSHLLNKYVEIDGDVDTRLVNRVAAGAPTAAIGFGAELLPESGGSVTITSEELAPDGSLTASLFSVPAGEGRDIFDLTVLKSSLDIDGGDFLIFGGWFRAEVLPNDINGGGGAITMLRMNVTSAQGLTLLGELTYSTFAILSGHVDKWKNVGWVPMYGIAEFSGTRVAQPSFSFSMHAHRDRSFYFWKLYYRIIKGSLGFDRATLIHYMNSIGVIPSSVSNGVVGLHDHQTFRTGQGPTGGRPLASVVGAGAQWFDTTINKPIWSDGSAWVDASGSRV